jgi:hypothetical protein
LHAEQGAEVRRSRAAQDAAWVSDFTRDSFFEFHFQNQAGIWIFLVLDALSGSVDCDADSSSVCAETGDFHG